MKKTALLEQLSRGMPLLGGFAHGAADPETGASRGETAMYEGIGGVLGGLGGALAGGKLGGNLAKSYSSTQEQTQNLVLALALLGTSLGTAVGTIPGRAMARRDIPSREELKKLTRLVEEMKKDRGSASININMPSEAHAETGEHKPE